ARSPSRPRPSRRSRVTPGRSSTNAKRLPTRRLNRVDLPTFGRPTMATVKLMRGLTCAGYLDGCLGGLERVYARLRCGMELNALYAREERSAQSAWRVGPGDPAARRRRLPGARPLAGR